MLRQKLRNTILNNTRQTNRKRTILCTIEGCNSSLYQRKDDQDETIRKTRMKEYKEKTDPIKEFYRDRILTTNANTSRQQVFWNVLDQIRKRK